MAKLFITRGLPGSGKTTFARKWVAEDPRRRARVNRDNVGIQLHGRRFYEDRDLMQDTEKAISIAAQAQVGQLLRRGWDVICDDTNLRRRFARDLRNVALLNGADFEVIDMLDVPFSEVIDRNELRAGTAAYVPIPVIEDMHRKFAGKNAYALPLEDEPEDEEFVEPYVAVPGTPKAVMVNIDGTVAIMAGRGPYDEHRVHEDTPNHAVIESVRAMSAAGYRVIFCSGRTDACRGATEKWLIEHVGVPIEALHMRRKGDMRKDSLVKRDLFNENIREHYDVLGVFDDREQVVIMWRSMGLTVFQVAEGKF